MSLFCVFAVALLHTQWQVCWDKPFYEKMWLSLKYGLVDFALLSNQEVDVCVVTAMPVK